MTGVTGSNPLEGEQTEWTVDGYRGKRNIQIKQIKVLYTYIDEGYTILKIRYYIFGQDINGQRDGSSWWLNEIGIIINQISEVEHAYKCMNKMSLNAYTKIMPAVDSTQTVISKLPSKFKQLLKEIQNHIKESHKNNLEALKRSSSTKNLALTNSSWVQIANRWIETSPILNMSEFANGFVGYVTEAAASADIGILEDLAKRCIKQLSDNQLKDAELFNWEEQ